MLVSVDSIVGSTPREAGAKMLITAEQQYGTIGGGNLEYQACRIARDQLELGEAGGLQRFPLGAGLGQCCGGLANLMFERLDADDVSAEKMLAGLQEEGVGVDYLIVGSVSEFGRSVESESGVFSRTKTQKAYAKVNVRLIDVSTGRILPSSAPVGNVSP